MSKVNTKNIIFAIDIEKGGQKSTFSVSRVKTALVVPLQELILDYQEEIETNELINRSSELIARAVNNENVNANVTADDVKNNTNLDELLLAIMAMRVFSMAIMGGKVDPNVLSGR
jgi:hypothetical protein